MTVVSERNFNDLVTPGMRQEYWRRVKDVLTDVFGERGITVDRHREGVEQLVGLARLLAYREDPLQVAADLAGRTISADDMKRYQDLFPDPIPTAQPISTLP
jgi:hypothetical protein